MLYFIADLSKTTTLNFIVIVMDQTDNNFVIIDDQPNKENHGTMSLYFAWKLADINRISYMITKNQQATSRVGRWGDS